MSKKRRNLRSGGGGETSPSDVSESEETAAEKEAAEKAKAKSKKESRGKGPKVKSGSVSAANSASLGGPSQNGPDSEDDNVHVLPFTPLKKNKERSTNVVIPPEQEVKIFKWLETKPQIWNKDRLHQKFPRADKLLLWNEIADKYGKTG